jgi:hypothetical protein
MFLNIKNNYSISFKNKLSSKLKESAADKNDITAKALKNKHLYSRCLFATKEEIERIPYELVTSTLSTIYCLRDLNLGAVTAGGTTTRSLYVDPTTKKCRNI